jgi:hypothetical protein
MAETKLDDNVTEPSTVQPGDAPADTTDPTEEASTVIPQPSAEALKQGTVNAVLPVTRDKKTGSKGKDRVEEYDAVKPDGSTVRVRRNIETGESEIVK